MRVPSSSKSRPNLAGKYRYRAGQFLTFRVPHPEGRVQPLLFAVQRPRDRRLAQG